MEIATTRACKPQEICTFLLVKLAMRCNINCTYCYWFRDASVYEKPAVLTPEVEAAFLARLEEHVQTYRLDSFSVVFHGGEPLLFGKTRFDALCAQLRQLETRTGCRIRLSMTTNGLLMDAAWARLFATHGVGVTISIDGPRRIHDARRLDFQNRGTFDRAVAAFPVLRAAGVEPGVIAVCNPEADPEEMFDFFVGELQVRKFDILIPDATHEEPPASIAPYYKRLFDAWYQRDDVQIRILEGFVGGLLGLRSGTNSIGYGAIKTVTMLTDGSLEPLDVLRTAGYGTTATRLNILEHDLHAIQDDPLWREVYDASTTLAPVCQRCPYQQACGGGHIASRWSRERRYDNASVYCEDIKDILQHIWTRMLPDLHIDADGRQIALASDLEGAP